MKDYVIIEATPEQFAAIDVAGTDVLSGTLKIAQFAELQDLSTITGRPRPDLTSVVDALATMFGWLCAVMDDDGQYVTVHFVSPHGWDALTKPALDALADAGAEGWICDSVGNAAELEDGEVFMTPADARRPNWQVDLLAF